MNLFDLCVYKNLNKGSGGDVDVSSLVATENKTYNAGEGKAYNPVVVNVPTPSPSLQSLTASHNGYFVPSSGYDGFDEVTVEVATPLETLSATENGTYTPSSGYEGFSEVTVDVPLPNNAYLLESQKDDVVTIQHGAEFDMPKLIASIEPQQDLHGYDSPWVGGAGKNKYEGSPSFDEYVNLSTWTKDSTTYNGHEVYKKDSLWNGLYKMITLPTGTYTFSCMAKSDNDVQATLYFSGKDGTAVTEPLYEKVNLTTSWQRVSGSFTVTTGGTIALRLEKSANVDGNVYVSEYQVESGSSATSYAPYENECPISGWTACNVVRTGKNLLNPSIRHYSSPYAVWGGSLTSNVPDGTLILEAGEYTFSVNQNVAQMNIRDNPDTPIVRVYNTNVMNFTLNSKTAVKIAIEKSSSQDIDNLVFQLELGSSPSTYEPFGNTYTINFVDGSSPLTVYGGTLNVLSGLLTITDGYISSYNGETLPSTWISDRDVYAEGTTPTTGAEVCYKLATPQTYQLTPTQVVKSLLGVNNIFADTGKVDVQIWTKEVTS